LSCSNQVEYLVEVGTTMRFVERLVKCGTTDPNGDRCICQDCESDPVKMDSIRRHQKCVDADNQWLKSAGYGEM